MIVLSLIFIVLVLFLLIYKLGVDTGTLVSYFSFLIKNFQGVLIILLILVVLVYVIKIIKK